MTDIKRDTRLEGPAQLQRTMRMALNAARHIAAQAAADGVDASIEQMPRMIGNHCVTFNILVVRDD